MMKVISLGFRTDLMLRRLAGSDIVDRGSHMVVRTPANPAHHWGNFVLLGAPPQPGDAPGWSAVFDKEFPDARHFVLGVDGTGGESGDTSELARLGLVPEVNAVLTAERLQAPARPAPGAAIRQLAGDDAWSQATRLRLACDDGPVSAGHRTFVERKQAEYRALCEAGHGAWFGAFVEGRMRSGVGVFSDGSGIARFQNVETQQAFRRRGLAASLVHRAACWALRELGARTLVIVADPDYHAIRLYRSLGFTQVERQVQLHRVTAPR